VWIGGRRRATQFLHALPQLILQSEVTSTLNRIEELRKLTLLGVNDIKPLPLQPDRLIEQLGDACFICCTARNQLLSQLTSQRPLTNGETHALLFELSIHGFKPRHLSVVKLQPLAHQLADSNAESLFQLLPARSFRLRSLIHLR